MTTTSDFPAAPDGYVANTASNIVHHKTCPFGSMAKKNTIGWNRILPRDRACMMCLPGGLPASLVTV